MLAISEGYKAAGGISLDTLPLVSSGNCYHLNRNFNPDTAHYGYNFLDPKDGYVYTSGSFRFFGNGNPYSHLTVEEARALSPDMYTDVRKVDMQPDYAFIDLNPKGKDITKIIRYWLKQNDSSVYLIGQWGVEHMLYCHFQKNQ